MTATYLIEVELDSPSEIQDVADEILDELTLSSIPVKSVKPWQRPTISTGTPLNNPNINQN